MIKVVCYCGSAYSFAGDVGVCPQCGEHVSFGSGPVAESQDSDQTIARILAKAYGGSPPEDLAA